MHRTSRWHRPSGFCLLGALRTPRDSELHWTSLLDFSNWGSVFILLPSKSEGWPKVLSEAMACGAVPIASNVGGIPEIMREMGVGRSLPANQIAPYIEAIEWYYQHPQEWKHDSEQAWRSASLFT